MGVLSSCHGKQEHHVPEGERAGETMPVDWCWVFSKGRAGLSKEDGRGALVLRCSHCCDEMGHSHSD